MRNTKENSRRYRERHPERAKSNSARWRSANREAGIAMTRAWQLKNLKRVAYAKQKYCAKIRGIKWNFTLDQWIEWWGEDFEKRGKGANHLCMARYLDEGPYELGNIQKLTQRENALAIVRVSR